MFRRIFFWFHLVLGLTAGLVIATLALTGATLAFEKQIVGLVESSRMQVSKPAENAKVLTATELLAIAHEKFPDQRPTGLTMLRGDGLVVTISVGRDSNIYLNPYTGEIVEPEAKKLRGFFHTMLELHRWLALEGPRREWGRSVTGAAGLVFFVLALSGLYLWLPRNWKANSVKAVLFLRKGAKGKARDWNWHNVFGFWFLPVVLVISGTGMVFSYRWASNLVFFAAGESAPVQGGGNGGNGGQGAQAPAIAKPPEGTARLPYEALFASAIAKHPQWESITLRLGNGRGGQRREGGGGGNPNGEQRQRRESENRAPRREGEAGPATQNGLQAVQLTVREAGAWPLFSSIQLSYNPFDGAIIATERFEDQSRGRRWRSWVRFLHTGEALGFAGQVLAFLGCLSTLLLVWTGFALSWRRFFSRTKAVSS